MSHRHLNWILAGLLIMSHSIATSAAPLSHWTVDDLLLSERATDASLAPGGSGAVWVRESVVKVEKEEKRAANLWFSSLDGKESFPLTQGVDQASSPSISPDGRHVAFLFDRKIPDAAGKDDLGDKQLWLLSLRGGEARPLTRFDRSVQDFAWRDNSTLIAVAPESPSSWELERKKDKDTAVVVDDLNEPPVRLFSVPLQGKALRLTTNRDWIRALAVAPDGKRAVITAAQDLKYAFDNKVAPETFMVDLSTGERHRLFQDSKLLPFNLRWATDSSGFYFVNDFSRHPRYRMAAISELYFYDLGNRGATKVELDWAQGLGGDYLPVADGVLALLEEGVYQRTSRLIRRSGQWLRQDLESTHQGHLEIKAVSTDGRHLVYGTSTPTMPPQLFGARIEGRRLLNEQQLSDLNSGFADKPTGRVDVIRWAGAEGEQVEGLLHFPLDWPLDESSTGEAEMRPRPLVVKIHGGPAAADRHTWSQGWPAPPLLFRQRGAFVLQVNYHGSSGYGLDWVESIAGRYYELESVDILNGIDHLVARGLADPDRLGCTGWSNGGILTADLITRTDRFKAASVGAADVEWISDWANVDFGAAFDNYYFGGTPWEKTEAYLERSPFFKLPGVTTPTIIYTGTEDRNVPPHQSWSLFRALQYHEKADTRLVLFPGEPHSLRKIPAQRRKVEEEMAWFDRYLFESNEKPKRFLKEDSPLAALLARGEAARIGSALGRLVEGKLVPEVSAIDPKALSSLDVGRLEVGRFEVTRAQLAAFDPTLAVPKEEENLPATGVDFETAQRYAAWLTELTGRSFRLPTEDEAHTLAKSAGTSGNTLDHWAGYSPNPEDAHSLIEEARALPGSAPLLLPVGSKPGWGNPPLFDLDGNAAEWAVTEDGRGIAVGASADRSSDERIEGSTDDPAYLGFRVMVSKG